MQFSHHKKLTYQNEYHSSYDYTVYDTNFVFCDEEELETSEEETEENESMIINQPSVGGNFH